MGIDVSIVMPCHQLSFTCRTLPFTHLVDVDTRVGYGSVNAFVIAEHMDSVTGLAIDTAKQLLYTASFTTGEIGIISLMTSSKSKLRVVAKIITNTPYITALEVRFHLLK